jgi:hypothetical protein
MPEHVRVDREGEAGEDARSSNELPNSCGRHRPAELADEQIRRPGVEPLKLAERAELSATDRVARREAVLQSSDMQRSGLELDLVPAERDELADAKPVTVGQEEEGAIAVSMPADFAGGGEELLDLVGSQVLSSAAFGVRDAPRGEGRVRGRSRSPLLGLPGGLRRGYFPI